MQRIITTIFLLTCLLYAKANESLVTISGIIKDKQTKQAIPFAHVIVGTEVRVTDIDGKFSIEIKKPKDSVALKVSYIGYITYRETIEEVEPFYTIYIAPSTTRLEDITVKSGQEIMNRAYSRFHLNYEMQPQKLSGYYQESMQDTVGLMYVTEGIMDVFTPSNLAIYATPVASLISSMKKLLRPIEKQNFLGGNACDMAHSSIWRRESFLNKRHRSNYYYYYEGTEQVGNHNALIVAFEPRNKRARTQGTFYIDDITYAILKIEYDPEPGKRSFWADVSWVEEYELVNGVFQLVNVSYQGNSKREHYTYHASLVVDRATTTYEVEDKVSVFGVYDSFFEIANENNTQVAFWKDFEYMKLNERISDLLLTTSR